MIPLASKFAIIKTSGSHNFSYRPSRLIEFGEANNIIPFRINIFIKGRTKGEEKVMRKKKKIDTNTSFNRWIAVHWPLTIRRKAIAVFLCCPTKRARKVKMFSFVYALSRFLRGSWHIHHLYRLAKKKLFSSSSEMPRNRD